MDVKRATRIQLERVVEDLREILYWDTDKNCWDPDKMWDEADFLDMIADSLSRNGLAPGGVDV